MTSVPILAVGFIMHVVAVLFVVSCVSLILIVLIQKGRGGGLSAAFGGGGAGGLLGSKTGDFLTWVTIGLVCMFLLLAVVTAKYYVPGVTEYDVPAPVDANAPVVEPAPPTADVNTASAPVIDTTTAPEPNATN